MSNRIQIEVETRSNLLIGGNPTPFEIGGIDQCTAIDEEGFPYIPASTLKGALRDIIAKDTSITAVQIANQYAEFLQKEKRDRLSLICHNLDEETRNRVEKRYEDAIESAAASYLFGIREFNNTPKILFNDLRLKQEYRNKKQCFSIDTKTSICSIKNEIRSNPRTYKVARKGLVFEGELELYHFEREFPEKSILMCRDYIVKSLQMFNEGGYRLGNSKSRGYGRIYVTVTEERREEQREKL